jgi:folate-binding protein YgfZ
MIALMTSPPGYDTLLSAPAVVRRTDRGVVRLRGTDCVTWLQGLITNDVAALEPGHRVYSAYLTPQGRMITDMWVVPTASALLLDVPAPLTGPLAARLDGLIFAEDVQIDDVSEDMAVFQLFGSTPADGLAAALVADETYGVASHAAYVPAASTAAFLASLGPAPTEVGLDVLDVLRVEAGVPRFLIDMTEDTIPLEAGLEDRAISFTKGCYVGQEVIVRVTTRGGGRVARKLVGLAMPDAAAPPPPDAPIRAGDRVVGRVTSAVVSPRHGGVIALGYAHRDFTQPGTSLEIDANGVRLAASVHELPFVPAQQS